MIYNKVTSSLRDFPTSNLIYSSFSAFADDAEGEIPGAWFVAALSQLGHTESSIRQNLFRMSNSGELIARKVGRNKLYRPGPYMEREIAAGRARILGGADDGWDGDWTLVQYATTSNDRNARERIRSILGVHGFAPLGNGVFVHPRDHGKTIADLVSETGLSEIVHVFRGRFVGGETDRDLIGGLWDLDDMAKRYCAFLKLAGQVETCRATATNLQAFQLRYFVVLEFLNIAWQDPDLPLDLLPKDWPGREAKERARLLYVSLLEPSKSYFDEVLKSLTHAKAR